jgi:diguanylate cyclase (GGDEF)-like protein/PAS domain S-box-containing protein
MTGPFTHIGLAALIAVLLVLFWRSEREYGGKYAKGLAWVKAGLILVGVSELVSVFTQFPWVTSLFDPAALRTVVFLEDVVGRLGGPALVIVGVWVWLPLIKRMGEARTSSEERYQYLVQNANMIILRWGSDGRVRFLNRFAEAFFGFPLKEILGKSVIGTIVPERESSGRDLVRMIEDIQENPEKYRDNENENMRCNGERVWLSWRNKAILDRYGNVSEILSLGIDVTERKRVQDAMCALASSTYQSADGEDFLHENLRNLAAAYSARYALVGIFTDNRKKVVRTLAVWTGEGFGENIVYELRHTPCEAVCEQGSLVVPRDAAGRYPNDPTLQQMGIQSYFGATLKNVSGEMLGVLCVMDTKPIRLSVWTQPLLGLFAERISAEMERKAADSELRLAARVFEESIGGIVIMDAEGRVLRVNKGFVLLTGYGADEVSGRYLHELDSGEHERATYNRIRSVIRRKGVWQGEFWERRKGGELFCAWLTISEVKDEQGEQSNYIAMFADITEKKASEERIFRLAHYDALTGLPNRVLFQDRLKQALVQARRHNQHLALLYIDLDRFKPVNDTLGHHVGDLVLKDVAARLKLHVRDSDTVARMGGDEFTVILSASSWPQDPITSITLVAEKLLHDLARPYHIDDHEVVLTASIGIVSYPEDGERMEEMVCNADAAMYHAKDQGRNTLQFYESGMNRRAMERMRMELELRKALERNELELLYQPVVDLENGALTAVEALVRWHHPRHGLLLPSQFIDIAEETGLIVALGDWVLGQSCRQMRCWGEAGLGLKRVAVNLSLRQLRAGGLAQIVEQCLRDHGLHPRQLCLEITESTFIDDRDSSIAALEALKDLGVSLAIDDFGTGYSSLAQLRKLPIETLKIDKSFIQDLPDDGENAEIVAAIIAMAHRLKLRTIAEGVERPQELEYLRGLRCDRAQGYLIHPPLAVDDCTRVLESGCPQAGGSAGLRSRHRHPLWRQRWVARARLDFP